MIRNYLPGPVVWLATIAVTCLILYVCQTILWLVVPVLLAVILYYVTEPVVRYLSDHSWNRETAARVVMALLILAVSASLIVSAHRLTHNIASWNKTIKSYVASGTLFIESSLRTIEHTVPFIEGFGLTRDSAHWTDKLSRWAIEHGREGFIEALHWMPSLILIPYLAYFMLIDGGRFKHFLVRAIPNAYFEKALLLFQKIDDQVRHYFQGLMALTFLDALCLGMGLKLMGISGAILLSIFVAILCWIPYVGSILGCFLVILVAAHDYPSQAWMGYAAVALFLAVRLLDDFVFMPMTVGRSLRIHPVVTVLMIFVGGAVAGISGLLLVLPVLGVVMVFGQILGQLFIDSRLHARNRHALALQRERANAGLKQPPPC